MLTASEAFDRVADKYDTTFTRPLNIAEDAIVFGAMQDLDHLNVLDLGCGTGLYLQYRKPEKYTGVDVSLRMIERGEAKYPDAWFLKRDMADLGELPRAPFDAIVSTHALSYSRRPGMVVLEMSRVLKPGGRFVVSVFGTRYRWRKSHIVGHSTYCHGYTAGELKGLFEDCFAGVEVQGVNLFGDTLAPYPGERIQRYLPWEARTLGRRFPSLCFYLIATGYRDA